MKKFNQQEYIQEYKKEYYRQFKVELRKEELEELNNILKEKGLSKAQFLRDAIEEIKKKKM